MNEIHLSTYVGVGRELYMEYMAVYILMNYGGMVSKFYLAFWWLCYECYVASKSLMNLVKF